MLYEKIENQKEVLDDDSYAIPDYITNNLRYPLYDWQKAALENFLIHEKLRQKKISKGEVVPPKSSYVQYGYWKRKDPRHGSFDFVLL